MTRGETIGGYPRRLVHPDECKGYIEKAIAIDGYGRAGIDTPDIVDANERLKLDLRRQSLSMGMV
ncbi:MAG: hypothetical protein HY831_04480 [Candidatus Aenigmarchaeota archaeon]|nr:hypothetical protein [Candidatus Aenigmarchaeota archaeon]